MVKFLYLKEGIYILEGFDASKFMFRHKEARKPQRNLSNYLWFMCFFVAKTDFEAKLFWNREAGHRYLAPKPLSGRRPVYHVASSLNSSSQ